MTLYSRKMEPLANDSFEARIVRALDERAEVPVPQDFAARVTASLPVLKPARKSSHAGRTLVVVIALVMLAVMVWLAPQSSSRADLQNLAFDLEMGLSAVLAGIALIMVKVWDRV